VNTPPLCIIQARLGSSRLPRKMTLTLAGHALLSRAWKQASHIFGHARTIIAVPMSDVSELQAVCPAARWFPHIGDERDLISRFWHAAQSEGATTDTKIVRWTPDDIRKDDRLVRLAVVGDLSHSVEQSVEVFTMAQLDHWYWTVPPEHREHIGHLLPARPAPPDDGLPWSVDTPEDYVAAVRGAAAMPLDLNPPRKEWAVPGSAP